MGCGSGPEPCGGWIGVVTTPRCSSISNFAATAIPVSVLLSPANQATSIIIDAFSNDNYGVLEVYVGFCIRPVGPNLASATQDIGREGQKKAQGWGLAELANAFEDQMPLKRGSVWH